MKKTIYFLYETARFFNRLKTKGAYCLSIAVTCFVLFASLTSNGQMVSAGDVFLRGAHLEAGIGKYGNFGSDVAAPAGYHPHFGGNFLSIVADPDATGWDTSTASHYWGDFFLPGFPFEGWTLQVDTMRCQGSNSGTLSPTSFTLSAGMPPCRIVNVAYSASGTTVSGTWQGLIDSVMLTQVTTLDTTALYFTVDITLTNLSVMPKDNIYYYRAADPDNDATWPGGSPVTENTIVYQAPNALNASVVSSTGHLAGSSYIALGSGDSASRVIVATALALPITQDLGEVYSTFTGGVALSAQGDSNYSDEGIGLIIKVAHLATVDSAIDSVLRTTATYAMHPANSANFKFFYAFTPSALSAAMAATRPDTAVTPVVVDTATGIKNVASSQGIRVYPNPAGSIINITGLNASDQVALYDMMGRIVNQASAATTGVNTLYVNSIPAGAYILEVNDASGNAKARVPVMKQ